MARWKSRRGHVIRGEVWDERLECEVEIGCYVFNDAGWERPTIWLDTVH